MKPISTLLLFFLCLNSAFAQPSLPKGVHAKLDLVYKTVGSWDGKLDIYVPEGKSKKALVIYIHGGGWTHGKKEAEYEKIKVFIENGFAVANVEYRLATQAPAPAAIEDVHCAISYLIQNADSLKLKDRKIVLMGGSAGAHLALLAGLQSNKPLYNGGCLPDGFKVAAIISKYGPTDLLTWEPATKEGSASATWLGNRRTDTAFIKSLSPYYLVAKQKIPVLFIHGDQDGTVPIAQSRKMYAKLQQHKFPAEIYVVIIGKHGNFGPVETPKMDAKMLDFLAKYVKE